MPTNEALIGLDGENHQSYLLTHGDNTAFINLDIVNDEEKTFTYI